MNTINFWPILISSVVAFAIGALWYSPVLFGKEWMSLLKITEKDVADMKTRGGMWKRYIAQFVMSLVMFAVLAFIIASSNGSTATDGAFLGFFVWLGFVLPISISSFLWKNQPFKLILIEAIQYLVTLVIAGGIIGAWK